jgi:hypothetical protein
MKRMLGTLTALAFALGASAAAAQSVQRDDETVGSAGRPGPAALPQARVNSPVQLAQASPGGAAAGASAGGAVTGIGFGTSLVLIGAAVAMIAITVDSGSTATTTHH